MEHTFLTYRHADGQFSLPQPFSDDLLIGIAPTSDLAVVVNRRVAPSARNATFTLRFWRQRGGCGDEVAVPYAPLELKRASRDSALLALVAMATRASPMSPVNADSIRRRMFVPKYWPPVASAVVSRDSLLWLDIRDSRPPAGALKPWRVLNAAGQYQRTVGLPSGCRLGDAYKEFVWCIEKDEDDVPVLTRYILPLTGGQ